MWSILKNLLAVLSCYDNTPTGGFLYDEKVLTFASDPVREYILQARERLSRRETAPLVQLGELQKGSTLIAHPLQVDEQWRNTVVQIFSSVCFERS